MTTTGEFRDLIKRLGVAVSFHDHGSIKKEEWLKNDIIPWLNQNGDFVIVFFVNSDEYKNGIVDRPVRL